MANHKNHTAGYIEVTGQDFAEKVLNIPQMVVVDLSLDTIIRRIVCGVFTSHCVRSIVS